MEPPVFGRMPLTHMRDEAGRRSVARDAIRDGRVPDLLPHRTWGGRGTGAICAICREPVAYDEVELELEFLVGNGCQAAVSHPVHLQCFAAWEAERQSPVADAPSGNGHLPDRGNDGRISVRELGSASGRGPG